jgi:CheY-like chemotaxis protein
MTGKFLYVEDQKDALDLIRAVLKDVEVVWAPTGRDALQLIEEGQAFDLYLIDHYLPDSTGLALCREIRGKDDFTPAVFVSACESLSIGDVRDAGGHGLVRKASRNFFNQLRQTVTDLAVLKHRPAEPAE